MPRQTFNRSALALSSLGVALAGLGYAFDIAWVFFPGLLMLTAGCVLRAALAHSGRRKLVLAVWPSTVIGSRRASVEIPSIRAYGAPT